MFHSPALARRVTPILGLSFIFRAISEQQLAVAADKLLAFQWGKNLFCFLAQYGDLKPLLNLGSDQGPMAAIARKVLNTSFDTLTILVT